MSDDAPRRAVPAPVIRRASVGSRDDAVGCLAVYAPYVRDTTITFETAVPAVEEFSGRIRRALAGHDWLVAELQGWIVGYAYAGPVKERAAYDWSCEVSGPDPDAPPR